MLFFSRNSGRTEVTVRSRVRSNGDHFGVKSPSSLTSLSPPRHVLILAHVCSTLKVVIRRHLLSHPRATSARPWRHAAYSTAAPILSDFVALPSERDANPLDVFLPEPTPSTVNIRSIIPSRSKWDWRLRKRRLQGTSELKSLKHPRRTHPQIQVLREGSPWFDEALRYQEHFTMMLEAERAEEEAVLRQRLATWGIQRLCEQGYAITDLTAYWVEKKANKALKTLSFQLGPGLVLPENRFEHGTQVLISRLDPLKEPPKLGSVVSRGKSHLRVGVEEGFEVDGAWRVDVGGSTLIYNRMISAVKGLGQKYAGGVSQDGHHIACSGTHVADVILPGFSLNKSPASPPISGIFAEDMRIASWAARYMHPNPVVVEGDPPLDGLNATQKRAMAMMIGERFSLIQGPPGTGKTRTIIETVKLLKIHFAVTHPLLVCTYTNVAVDNLVEGMAAAGLKPLRVAFSGKAKPNLEEHTLEWKLQKHPLFPDTEKLAKDLEALTDQVNKYRDDLVALRGHDKGNAKKIYLLRLESRREATSKRLFAMRRGMVRDILEDCDVVCTTCLTSAASVLGVADFPVVFLDEASMSTEPASLVPLMKGARHVSLIGDHKQLPPVITSSEAKALGLGVSLFERLIEEGRVPSIMLDTQYRMHPTISAFPSLEFYDLSLRDGIGGEKPLKGMANSVVFIDHAGAESMKDRSRVNWNEAHIVMGVIEELLSANEDLSGHDIGIIAPYAAQISLLTRMLNVDPQYTARFERTLGHKALQLRHIEIKTVDGFEGREKQVIIFSTVRNNSRGDIGFLADRGRLNVGLTRAKRGLFVVGSVDTLSRGKAGRQFEAENAGWRAGGAESWRRYAGYCLKQGLVVKMKQNQLSQALYGVQS